MTATLSQSFTCNLLHPILPVPDILATVDFYATKLGFRRGFIWGDPPVSAGLNLGNVEMHVQHGTANPAGCSLYFVVDDTTAFHAVHAANGVEIVAGLEDKPWGMRQYSVRDLNGYTLSFGEHLPSNGPAVPIERVAVSVRLEKRLAALLRDLAAHKGMSLGSALEETLLHSFEKTGPGNVASPHTEQTLKHIDSLKQKHGIDYDAHASYRFVEKSP
jgi:catechol 2,3-dioxygenase-like lactoylglutathione lyase family enzyme